MSGLDTRIQEAVQKREQLAKEVQRLSGRREEAEARLRQIDDRCREQGLDPAHLDATILELETRCSELVLALERDLQTAAHTLAPYLENG